jgi:hypothetical protein
VAALLCSLIGPGSIVSPELEPDLTMAVIALVILSMKA